MLPLRLKVPAAPLMAPLMVTELPLPPTATLPWSMIAPVDNVPPPLAVNVTALPALSSMPPARLRLEPPAIEMSVLLR